MPSNHNFEREVIAFSVDMQPTREVTHPLIPRTSLRSESIETLARFCAIRFKLRVSADDAYRVLSVRLCDLTGGDDATVRTLGALAASRIFTPETVVRLALAHIHDRVGTGALTR